MASQSDIDQGGTARQWIKSWMGPSIGWQTVPLQNVLAITAPGTYQLNLSTSLVTVNSGSVTIKLPTVIDPSYSGAGVAQPGLFANNPITIVDIGGTAAASPITIQPFSVAETIMGFTSFSLNLNYGGVTFLPESPTATWNGSNLGAVPPPTVAGPTYVSSGGTVNVPLAQTADYVVTTTALVTFNLPSALLRSAGLGISAATNTPPNIRILPFAGQTVLGQSGLKINTPDGSYQLVPNASGSGDWYQRDRNISISVLDFGAVGDGATDDTAAIQAAFNSGMKEIFIPDGTFLCHDVAVPNTVGLIRGTGTLKSNKSANFGSVLLIDSFSGDCSIQGIAIDGTPNPGTGLACIQFQTTTGDCKNIRVLNCKFKSGGGNLLLFDPSGVGTHQFIDIRVEQNYFDSSAATGGTGLALFFSPTIGSTRFVFRNNVCQGDGTNAQAGNHSVTLISGTVAKTHLNPLISNNTLSKSSSTGGGIWVGNSTGALISNNIIYLGATAIDGIELNSGGGGTVQDAIISGNVIFGDSTTGDLGIGVGMSDNNTSNVTKGVQVVGNTIRNTGNAGILVFTWGVNNTQNVTVNGNYILNPSQGGIFPALGISAFSAGGGTNSNIRISGNVIDTNTSNTNAGISLDSTVTGCETFNNVVNMTGGSPSYTDAGTNNVSDYWTAYTPVVTPSATPGSFAYTATGKFKRIGQGTIAVHIEINVTTVSTAAGVLNVTLPINATSVITMNGQNKTSGNAMIGNTVTAGTNTLAMTTYNVAFPVTGNSQFLGIDGTYQIGA